MTINDSYYDEIIDNLDRVSVESVDGVSHLISDHSKLRDIAYNIRVSRILNLIKSEIFKNNFNALPLDEQAELRLAINSFLDDNIIDGYISSQVSVLANRDVKYITDGFEIECKLFNKYWDLIKSSGTVSLLDRELERYNDKMMSNVVLYDKIIDRIDESEKIVENGDKIISHFDLKLLDNLTSRIRKIRFIRLIRSEKFKNNFIKLSNDDQMYILKYVEKSMTLGEYNNPISDKLIKLLKELTGVSIDYILGIDQTAFDLIDVFDECIKLPDMVSKIYKENE